MIVYLAMDQKSGINVEKHQLTEMPLELIGFAILHLKYY